MNTRRNSAMLFASLLVLLVLHNSCGFPDGAPNKRSVCKTLHPHHKRARSQKTPSPYSLVGKKKIPCGTAVNISITAEPGHPYKGFIMQARPISGQSKPLGNFTITDPIQSKTINCYGLNNNTVTHTSPALKTFTSFVWSPPPKYKGHVVFHATVVKDFSTFWTNVTSKLEVSCSEGNYYADMDEEVIENNTSVEDDYGDSESVDLTVYEECGVTKVCFGIPDDCVATRSCDSMVTVTSKESKYEFEMLGKAYVGVSFSESGDLNIDSLTECILVNDADVKLYQTRYESSTGYLRQHPSNDLEFVNYSYWDGMVYCKFVRDDEVKINGVRFNFKTKKYYIILASASAAPEESQNKTKSDSVRFHASERKDYLSNITGFLSPSKASDTVPKHYEVKQYIFDFIFGIVRVAFNIL